MDSFNLGIGIIDNIVEGIFQFTVSTYHGSAMVILPGPEKPLLISMVPVGMTITSGKRNVTNRSCAI